MDFTIISHVKKNEFTPTDEWAVQSNEEHNQGVANWAGLFAGEFDCADWGKVIGHILCARRLWVFSSMV